LSSLLKEGITLANFQSDGNLQVRKEYLNRILRGKHIVSDVNINFFVVATICPHFFEIYKRGL
jgi:predicted adenine nucleotide alpha hydrolase (AANH) superfamily ATPase